MKTSSSLPLAADFGQLDESSPFHSARRAAYDAFTTLGFPTMRDEEWRYTRIKPLTQSTLRVAGPAADVAAADLGPHRLEADAGDQLVFVNGRFRDDLSTIGPLPRGAYVGSLAAADTGTIDRYLSVAAKAEQEAFTALNTAFITDGVFISLPKNTKLERTVHLLFVTAPDRQPVDAPDGEKTIPVTLPRILIAAAAGSQATIVERYASLGRGPTFTNTVTEIIAGDDVNIDHHKATLEDEETFHVSNLWTHQSGPGVLTSHNMTMGGRLVRHNVDATLDAEGCETTFNGLYLTRNTQHVDNHLRVHHLKPHCRSWEYYRGVLDDRSTAVFSGRIFVAEDAQKTDAKQTNQNLLLSDEAGVTTKPQLEIFADDVKCTHGATIGQLEESQLFYLQARGIDRETARSLLIYAFANETLSEIRVDALRQMLEPLILDRLPNGRRLVGGL